MKKILFILCLCILSYVTLAIPGKPVSAAPRVKSSVLTIYLNNSGTTYNKELDKIVNEELQKRLEGIYIELDNDAYLPLYLGKSFVNKDTDTLLNPVKDSGAKYFIYLELLPFVEKSDYNFVYHNKAMTSSVYLCLMDVANKTVIYKEAFSLKEKDTTDNWWIGDKSVAKLSLKTTMFKVGELISVKLPL